METPVRIVLSSLAETAALGGKIATIVEPGDLLVFSGELGAGKTFLIGAIALALGVGEPVTSPTFSLVHEYDSQNGRLLHADFYRLLEDEEKLPGEVVRLGLREERAEGAILLVEWGDDVIDLLGGRPTLCTTLARISDSVRVADVVGERAGELL